MCWCRKTPLQTLKGSRILEDPHWKRSDTWLSPMEVNSSESLEDVSPYFQWNISNISVICTRSCSHGGVKIPCRVWDVSCVDFSDIQSMEQTFCTPFPRVAEMMFDCSRYRAVTASSREIKSNVWKWFPYWSPVDFALIKSAFWNDRSVIDVIWISAQHLDWHFCVMTFPYLLNLIDGCCIYFQRTLL